MWIVRNQLGVEWSRHKKRLDAIWAADSLWRDGFRVRISKEYK